MTRPPTAACAAVWPIVVFEMAFSVLSRTRKSAGNRDGLSGLAGSRRARGQPRDHMADRAKKAPGNVQPLPAASRMLILEASGRPFNISLDYRSGARPSPPPWGDVRARALERDRGPTLLRAANCALGRPWR